MAHIFRFFGSKVAPQKWDVALDEVEHLRKVLKLRTGDAVELMDGQGIVAQGVLSDVSRDKVLVEVSSEVAHSAPKTKKAVALGALKPGDIDDILTDLVELGIDEVHVFQQSDVAKHRTGDKPRDRWHRLIRSAAKQCKTAWSPTIHVHDSLEEALTCLDNFQHKFVLDAGASQNLLDLATSPLKSLAIVIGSERGLNAREVATCEKKGFKLAKIGAHVLRARTAAVAAAALLGAISDK